MIGNGPVILTRRTAAAAVVGALAIGVAALVTAQPPATAPAPAPQEVPPLDFKPITYFNDRCGSCHGNYGAFWGDGFVRHLDDRALREVVKEMAEGPAQAPLERQPLDALVAYHRSLADGDPYVIITGHVTGTLTGEVTPGATVVVQSADRSLSAEVDLHSWSVVLEDLGDQWTVVATKDQKTTRLRLNQWHSHGK